ncbi:MAG: hypothetical protein JSU63_17525 [Phycisphaerales bacterium]|nr:MAG: hypothetical protein JSU63_17525 [Phycisphaerales bacterium]
MAILAGIDEAGYGPILGPLVVSSVAFRVPDASVGACLWKALARSSTPKVSRGARRLAIADSKKLYSRGKLGPLERAALVMLAVRGHRPGNMPELLDLLAPGGSQIRREYPWYCDEGLSLPLSNDVGDVATRANAVRLDCAENDIELTAVRCELLLAAEYNQLVKRTRNKAVVLLGLALRLVYGILRRSKGQRVRLCVDRLGGRQHYRESLSTAFPQYELQIVEESPARSAYRLTHSSQVCEIEFVTNGETHHLPVALASVYSKYVRELHMHLFNRYWSRKQGGLKPTAGYYTDAKRWLKDASRMLDRLNIDRSMLVRER